MLLNLYLIVIDEENSSYFVSIGRFFFFNIIECANYVLFLRSYNENIIRTILLRQLHLIYFCKFFSPTRYIKRCINIQCRTFFICEFGFTFLNSVLQSIELELTISLT